MRRYGVGLHLLMTDPYLLRWKGASKEKEMCKQLPSHSYESYDSYVSYESSHACALCPYDSCRWSLCSYFLMLLKLHIEIKKTKILKNICKHENIRIQKRM